MKTSLKFRVLALFLMTLMVFYAMPSKSTKIIVDALTVEEDSTVHSDEVSVSSKEIVVDNTTSVLEVDTSELVKSKNLKSEKT